MVGGGGVACIAVLAFYIEAITLLTKPTKTHTHTHSTAVPADQGADPRIALPALREDPWTNRHTVRAACYPFNDSKMRIVDLDMAFLSRAAEARDGSKALGVKVREGSQGSQCVVGA
jgi:hypothetical protein